MAEELSGVLDHIEKIGELGDLADVPPTSHVVEVENALRADEPRPSLPREVVLAAAPDPSPTASASRARAPRPTHERAARAHRGPGRRGRAHRHGRRRRAVDAPTASARSPTS